MSTHAYIESERVRESFADRARRMAPAELRAELWVGGGFLSAALALLVLAGTGARVSLGLAVLYVLGVAAVGHVRFDIGSGFTVPTQAVFVPMLFALPVALVPALVAVALALGMAPAILTGRVPASRALTVPGNSWFAWGPALVLALAHDHTPTARPLVLVLALAAQFGCDFAANAAREKLRGGVSVGELARECRQVYAIDLALAPLGLVVALAALSNRWAVLLIAPLLGMLRWFSKERRARLEQLIELNDAYRGTALVLGDVVEADDTYTGEHCKDVVALALDVARELGLDAARRRNVEFGALLHDVGKISVPKEIVNKAGGLSDEEWEVMRRHTIIGQRMLDRVGGALKEVGEVVRASHERWDGTGYPDGLSGEDIPLASRIVCAADAFSAMTTDRPYRAARDRGYAIAELREQSGRQFDPAVAEATITVVERYGLPRVGAVDELGAPA
jgi:putative nucleotidyltransferase with HDIG domain